MTAPRATTTGVPPSVVRALTSTADILVASALEAMPKTVLGEVRQACAEGGHLCARIVFADPAPPRVELSVIDRPGKRLDLGTVVSDTEAASS